MIRGPVLSIFQNILPIHICMYVYMIPRFAPAPLVYLPFVRVHNNDTDR